ncbi:hypothetical protein MSG28_001163 [Choristoneura fumiferana]|uniref:Uncharacterized protein n=1 Tax=Choristoneura fumiferana TaxID=7141 RepID=A0ACC0K4I4_CHOFU|nr:hypothetical protein MSG28_001163 [Choristoneura fumiferana]
METKILHSAVSTRAVLCEDSSKSLPQHEPTGVIEAQYIVCRAREEMMQSLIDRDLVSFAVGDGAVEVEIAGPEREEDSSRRAKDQDTPVE